MDAKTQRKVLDLFDAGKLPQQIVDQLGISMLDVVAALRLRLRIEDSAVEKAANDESRKQRAVDTISDRLRVVEGSTPAAAASHSPTVADTDPPAPAIEAGSAESAVIGEFSEHALVDLVRAGLARLEPGLTAIAGDHPAADRDPGSARICARDRAGASVLIEVTAKATSPDQLVRLLAAMGAMQEGASQEGAPQQVRGILIATHFSDEIRHAARTVSALELRICQITLSFAEA